MRAARAPRVANCSSDRCSTQLETGTQKCWLLSNQAHSNSNYKPNKRPPPAGIADQGMAWQPGCAHCGIGNCSQMKCEPNGNAKTVPKHKFVAALWAGPGRGRQAGRRAVASTAHWSLLNLLCARSAGAGIATVRAAAACSLQPVRPAFLSHSRGIFAIYKFIVDCGELRKIANNCGKFQFVQRTCVYQYVWVWVSAVCVCFIKPLKLAEA